MANSCDPCDGRCCRYFSFEIDQPVSFRQFENLRWFVLHKGVSIHVDHGEWYIAIATPCTRLGDDNRCTIYTERPLVCRTYSTDSCELTEGDYDYEAEFHTPEDIDAYARKTLGADYEKAKAKAFAVKKGKKG